jgi:hypothetical protein
MTGERSRTDRRNTTKSEMRRHLGRYDEIAELVSAWILRSSLRMTR